MSEFIQNLIKFDTKFSHKFNEGIYREIIKCARTPKCYTTHGVNKNYVDVLTNLKADKTC